MRRIIVLFLGCMCALIGGCTSAQQRADRSEIVLQYSSFKPALGFKPNPNLSTLTARDATYTLCRIRFDLFTLHDEVLENVQLKKGERIGFEGGPDGTIIAIFGAQRRSLSEAGYRWYREKSAGEIAGEVAAGIGLGILMIPLFAVGGH